jgi:hypothetical protein
LISDDISKKIKGWHSQTLETAMELTLAINRYDRHVPFFNGTVDPRKGVTFKPLEVGESSI